MAAVLYFGSTFIYVSRLNLTPSLFAQRINKIWQLVKLIVTDVVAVACHTRFNFFFTAVVMFHAIIMPKAVLSYFCHIYRL